MKPKPTAYWDYIKVEELLSLQSGLGKDEGDLTNDEVLFITVHQIDELWFKLVIRELVSMRDLFSQKVVEEQALSSAVRGIKRTITLLENISAHFGLMESVTTRDYLGFRDKLSPASGFQSAQLREIEVILGLGHEERVPLGNQDSYRSALRYSDGRDSPALARVDARVAEPISLKQAIHEWLYRTPIQGSRPGDPKDGEAVLSFIEAYLQAHSKAAEERRDIAIERSSSKEDLERLSERAKKEQESARSFLMAQDVSEEFRAETLRTRAALIFIESYRELPLLAWPREIVEGILALEQSMLIFRQRHARMVERVIGRRTGTGGSAGVDYLDATALKYRVFSDIWAVRTVLLRQGVLPEVQNEEVYSFSRS